MDAVALLLLELLLLPLLLLFVIDIEDEDEDVSILLPFAALLLLFAMHGPLLALPLAVNSTTTLFTSLPPTPPTVFRTEAELATVAELLFINMSWLFALFSLDRVWLELLTTPPLLVQLLLILLLLPLPLSTCILFADTEGVLLTTAEPPVLTAIGIIFVLPAFSGPFKCRFVAGRLAQTILLPLPSVEVLAVAAIIPAGAVTGTGAEEGIVVAVVVVIAKAGLSIGCGTKVGGGRSGGNVGKLLLFATTASTLTSLGSGFISTISSGITSSMAGAFVLVCSLWKKQSSRKLSLFNAVVVKLEHPTGINSAQERLPAFPLLCWQRFPPLDDLSPVFFASSIPSNKPAAVSTSPTTSASTASPSKIPFQKLLS
ncbi:hypothetical protein GQX74_012009 [Glossina fuscipes]|nr:hypothetical protein GQX74_012009 [Glossina fuscipes]